MANKTLYVCADGETIAQDEEEGTLRALSACHGAELWYTSTGTVGIYGWFCSVCTTSSKILTPDYIASVFDFEYDDEVNWGNPCSMHVWVSTWSGLDVGDFELRVLRES